MSELAGASVRDPAVAGSFYPAAAEALASQVDEMLREAMASGQRAGADTPKAIIAPHAGFVYSGPVAASAYARLARARHQIKRVVLLGPSHRVAVRGLALSGAEGFATPLGVVPIDRDAVARLASLPQVHQLDAAHAQEHSLEVHLPFLQKVLAEFTLVPIVVGQAEPDEVAEVLRLVWGGPETLIVVSSDLSHYHDYDTARRMDSATAAAIATLDVESISDEGACGRMPIRGLLVEARRRGLHAALIDLRNSGDTAGPRDRVVGYASILFTADPAQRIAEPDRRQLMDVATGAIRVGLRKGSRANVALETFPAALQAKGACFVTLDIAGRLRGCIGTLRAVRPLVADAAWNAYGSAFEDKRFEPLTEAEYENLRIGISVLGDPMPLRVASEDDLVSQLRPGVDGLILEDGKQRGTFLPQVWQQLAEPREFVARLKAKAGIAPGQWPDGIGVWRYTTESFGGTVAKPAAP